MLREEQPKSASFTTPSLTRRLEGLRSRWMMRRLQGKEGGGGRGGGGVIGWVLYREDDKGWVGGKGGSGWVGGGSVSLVVIEDDD